MKKKLINFSLISHSVRDIRLNVFNRLISIRVRLLKTAIDPMIYSSSHQKLYTLRSSLALALRVLPCLYTSCTPLAKWNLLWNHKFKFQIISISLWLNMEVFSIKSKRKMRKNMIDISENKSFIDMYFHLLLLWHSGFSSTSSIHSVHSNHFSQFNFTSSKSIIRELRVGS